MTGISRPVVVGVDGSPASRGAVRWAVDESIHRAAPLLVVHAFGAPDPDDLPAERHRVALDAAAEARAWWGSGRVTTVTAAGSAVPLLVDQSRHACLVVVASRGHGGFTGLLVGSVSARLAAQAHCPVLVVHHGERWVGPESSLPRHGPVVVGVGGSATTQHTLGLAFGEAASRDLPLVALHAWTRPEHRRHRRAGDPAWLETVALNTLAGQVEPWRAKFPDVRVRMLAPEGGAAAALVEQSRSAVLVVVGAHDRGDVDDVLLIGSVTQQVLHHADCSVLVDHTD
jgi:nucleotide-binding universal stress UspA family protein